ncbi:MAG TPA: MFS transporter [Thermotogota bacterium]|nr:MFS transporter [Thermotogota bacterium]HRW92708.1 MFS transporter [Thermotogota bacterium]
MSSLRSNPLRFFLITASLGYFTLGFTNIITGSVLPLLETSFQVTHAASGLVLSFSAMGFFLASFLVIFLEGKIGYSRVIFSGAALFFSALALLLFARNFTWLLLAKTTMSFGGGLVETGIAVGVSQQSARRAGRVLNYSQALFAAGCILSPIVVSLFVSKSTSVLEAGNTTWQSPFFVAMGVSLLFLLFTLPLLLRGKAAIHESRGRGIGDAMTTFQNPLFWLTGVVIFLYVGAEVGASSWITSYVFETKNIPLAFASLFPSLLWVGLFVGRLLTGWLVEKWAYTTTLFFLITLALASSLLLFFARTPFWSTTAVLLLGFGFSGTFPTVQGILIHSIQPGNVFALSLFSALASAGAFAANLLIGKIGDLSGLSAAFVVILLFIFFQLLLTFGIQHALKTRHHSR